MPTLQDRRIRSSMTEGSNSLGFIQKSKAEDQRGLLKNVIRDPQLDALTEPRMLMTVIAMTVGLCMLWFLVMFTLYLIARFALYGPPST